MSKQKKPDVNADLKLTDAYKQWGNFLTELGLITQALNKNASKQLKSENTTLSKVEDAEADLNSNSTKLNGAPPNLTRPTQKEVMEVLNAELNDMFPPTAPSGYKKGDPKLMPVGDPKNTKTPYALSPSYVPKVNGVTPFKPSDAAVTVSQALAKTLFPVLNPPPITDHSASAKMQREIQKADIGWLEQAIENTISVAIASIPPYISNPGGQSSTTPKELTKSALTQTKIQLYDAVEKSTLFPKPGSETFLTNLTALMVDKLMEELPNNYTITITPKVAAQPPATGMVTPRVDPPHGFKKQLRVFVEDVLGGLFDTGGTQGAVVTFAAAQETIGHVYNYANDLMDYAKDYETLISDFSQQALTTAQDISTAWVSVQAFSDTYQSAVEALDNAGKDGQGGSSYQIIKEQLGNTGSTGGHGSKGSGIGPLVTQLTDASQSEPKTKGPQVAKAKGGAGNKKEVSTGNLALSELSSVTMASQAAGLKFSNATLEADKKAALTATQSMYSNAATDFTNAMANLKTDMASYMSALEDYLTINHQFNLAQSLNAADSEASGEINQILKIVPHPKSDTESAMEHFLHQFK